MVRVRFAPSPTGDMHIGGLRTALYNYLFAKRHGGEFLLRIEDTDRTRLVEGSQDGIMRALKWAGMEFDGEHGPGTAPAVQSRRTGIYQDHAAVLLSKGGAYHCFCPPSRLESLRESQRRTGRPTTYDGLCRGLSKDQVEDRLGRGDAHTIRLKVPRGFGSAGKGGGAKTVVDDLVVGQVTFDHSVIDDQILMKSDGLPTYHLASVVDDHLQGITHVIRGVEWLPSTPKHALLYKYFGWTAPAFAHLPLLLNTDGSKLSKRDGNASMGAYMDGRYLPAAVMNFVALLGWHPGSGATKEVFGLGELEEAFSIERVNKSGAVVDTGRMRWINQQHLARAVQQPGDNPTAPEEMSVLASQLNGLLQDRQGGGGSSGGGQGSESNGQQPVGQDEDYLKDVVASMQTRLFDLHEYRDHCAYYFDDPPTDMLFPEEAGDSECSSSSCSGHHPHHGSSGEGENSLQDDGIAGGGVAAAAAAAAAGHASSSTTHFFSQSSLDEAKTKLWAPSKKGGDDAPAERASLITAVLSELSDCSDEEHEDPDAVNERIKKVAKGLGLKVPQVLKPLRFVLTGSIMGAPVHETIAILGRAVVQRRLSNGADRLIALAAAEDTQQSAAA